MRRNWVIGRAVGVAAVLVVGLAGCGSDSAEQAGDPASGGNGAGIGRTPTGTFLSTEVTENGKPRELVTGTLISLRFEDGQVSANAGCNTMTGPARFADGTLVVSDLAMTEMGCPGTGRHEQDQFVADFLTGAPAYSFDGTTLKLNTATVGMVLGPREQVQPDLPLEGTRWDVTHTTQGPAADAADDPNAAVSAGMAPPKAYLEFADGRVTGSDGCNRISGTAVIADDTITFGPLAATKMACPGVEGTDAVHEALTGEVQWRIDYDILTLTSASGAGLQLQAKQKDGGGASGPAPDATATPPCCKPAPEGSATPAVAEDLPLNVPESAAPPTEDEPAVDPNY
jgi:heat shock protein HslJ